MGSKAKKNQQLLAQIEDLEIKKRNGLLRAVAAIVFFTVLIVLKLELQRQGVEFANTELFNLMFFLTAIVAAAVAGLGTRDWSRARRAMNEARAKLRK